MQKNRITCPCCGRELKITKEGAVVAVGTLFDTKMNEQIAQKLKASGLEFGVAGGETDE